MKTTKKRKISPALANATEKTLVFLILFFAGTTFCLPVPYSTEIATQYPWWAKRISIGNILFHEAVFVVWLVGFGLRFSIQPFLTRNYPGRQAGVLLTVLAIWCGMISLTAPLPHLDIGRTLRLLLNVVLFFATIRWARRYGTFPLTCLIFGFFLGTMINLLISFQFPLIVGGIMRLSGQNTPGVAMGIAVHLTAWLFFHSHSQKIKIFTIIAVVIFLYGCMISYSRIGWYAGATGALVWMYVFYLAKAHDPEQIRSIKLVRKYLTPLLTLSLIFFLFSPMGQQYFEQFQRLFEQKQERQSESNTIRWSYLIGTVEILSKSPLGVGYSGFYDAMMGTEVYIYGNATEEESRIEANPHASILWYSIAGGIPGVFLTILAFVFFLNTMRIGLICNFRKEGLLPFLLIATCYVVIALTVPYIFNSIILIIPTAIAAGWGWEARMGQNK